MTQLLAIARDVTDVVQVEERLTEAALHDQLTGLPNRRGPRTGSASRCGAPRGRAATWRVLFCDLDGFKHVNDTAGHAAGGAVLVVTAERLVVDGVPHVVTASIGTTFASSGDDPEDALRDADSAMYRARTRGKDRHEVFESRLRADAVERSQAEQGLRTALPGRASAEESSAAGPGEPELSLAHQPIPDRAAQRRSAWNCWRA